MVIFMAHPVGAATKDEVVANIKNAKAWYHTFIRSFDEIAIIADWITSCETLDDMVVSDRLRGQRANAELLARADELWLCGGRISSGMRSEMFIAHALDKPIRQWLDLGTLPPDTLSGDLTLVPSRHTAYRCISATWEPRNSDV
jgi:hypothetical protein